jgi:hypothetical protein
MTSDLSVGPDRRWQPGREWGVVLAAFDAPRSGCDDVGAVLVVALVAPDLRGVSRSTASSLAATASALCSSYPGHGCAPSSFATRSVIVARFGGLPAGSKET